MGKRGLRFSLEGKLALAFAAALLAGLITMAIAVEWLGSSWLALLVAAPLATTIGLYLLHLFVVPFNRVVLALVDGVSGLSDGDFSLSIAETRNDELGRLVGAYNEVGDVLRAERQSLYQRELMLDTVIQTSPLALVLTGPSDAVVYSNNAARQLLLAGRKLEGHRFLRLLEDMPAPFKSAVEAPGDGLFTVDGLQEPETFHLARKRFVLNGQPHRLFLFKQLTRELGRAEVETWKKVIRVIGHELNNSLAPISSLAHSGRQLAQRDRADKLAELFATVEERSRHLKLFIDGYARFAKLPKPRPAEVEWESFVTDIGNLVAFRLDGELPHSAGWFDPAQVQQVLINLLKNAHESGSEPGEVALDIAESGGGFSVAVLDRGQGMSESVLDNALLPFYSTKRSGSGLGLPLCREVVEAHGGRLRLVNRKDGGLAAMLWLPARPRAAGSSD